MEDIKINVKIRLAALWITVMLLYIYGDIFSFFVPGHMKALMDGHMGLGKVTPGKMVFIAVMMVIPALMVYLSLVLKPAINRILNIVVGALYTVIMVLAVMDTLDPWWAFYVMLGVIEMLITILIVIRAWRWPRA